MVKWVSVKIVVDGKDETRCDPGCPHFSQKAIHERSVDAVVERCSLYQCELAFRRRCDWCMKAKEL